MNIAIIGAGNVGGTLGRRWASLGHGVTYGVRDTAAPGLPAPSATPAEAARAADVVVLALPWSAVEATIPALGDLSGKILVDATNPLLPGLAGLEFGATTSAGELVARWAPAARVVKAFNTVGFNVMENPAFPDGPAALFYCGDDPAAKQTVAALAADLGFDPLDAGPLTQARVLEPFAMLWISLAAKYGYTRNIAFKLMRRSPA